MTHANGWQDTCLGDVLVKNENVVSLLPDDEYREVTIRLWGKGVVLRRVVAGADIAAQKRFLVSTDQFILSRIDARNGATGIVPPALDGAIVTNDFPSFEVKRNQLVPAFLGWLSKTPRFLDMCRRASEGTTNRVRLKENRFLRLTVPLPPVEEQARIAARIDSLASKIKGVLLIKSQIWDESMAMLRARFAGIVENAPCRAMADVAPLVRRRTEPRFGEEYHELGVRSFGKGTFHKPALDYLSVGSKKLYRIQPGDLVFNNVFAWEGAIAVAQPEDHGRFGSHRFITCVPESGTATADFLCFYFLTPEGLERIGQASPGGAGRNRTLGLKKLADIEVPVPAYDQQQVFGRMLNKVRTMRSEQETTVTKLDAILPSVLDRAFRGEL